MRYYLGIDGGGTKTEAVVLARNNELGRGHGGPCNIATCDDATLTNSVSAAVHEAIISAGLPLDTSFAGVCAGVAGYTAKGRRADFARLLAEIAPAKKHRVEPDFVIAYWGATEGSPGLIVSAGTGTVLYGRNVEGRSSRADGRGFLIGDRGSAFEIGRWALQYLTTIGEERWSGNSFVECVLVHMGAVDLDDVVEWVYRDFTPARIAGLAKVVGELAREENGVALQLIQSAGTTLGMAAANTLHDLDMTNASAIYLLGGLWKVSPRLQARFEEWLLQGDDQTEEHTPIESLDIRSPKHDAAYGAALLAMQAA
jgi:N-acetylglucosamine kinase-like BadF-type ATPase